MNSTREFKSVQDTQNQTPESSNIFLKNDKPALYFSMLQKMTEDKNIAISTSLQKIQTKNSQKSDIELLHHENKNLRQQNRELKRQLNQIKGQTESWTADSSRHQVHQIKQLSYIQRQHQKKQTDEIGQLNSWVETLKKQCKMYQEIIDKMDEKITTLEQINNSLKQQVKKLQIQKHKLQKTHATQKIELIQKNINKQNQNKLLVKEFKDKINRLMEKYGQLQSYANDSEIQWTIWKQKWNYQKLNYITKIVELQQLLREFKDNSKMKNITISTQVQKDYNKPSSRYYQYESKRNSGNWGSQTVRPRNPTSTSYKSKQKQRRKY